MDPRPSGRRPVFATRSPPGYHSDDITQTQPLLQDASSYPTRTDPQNDGSHRFQGLNVIQVSPSPNHVSLSLSLYVCVCMDLDNHV